MSLHGRCEPLGAVCGGEGVDDALEVVAQKHAVVICARRVAPCSACCLSSSISYRRARSICMQTSRFWICERWSCDWTTVLVGRWVMRTAEYVVLTHWPPGPLAQ